MFFSSVAEQSHIYYFAIALYLVDQSYFTNLQ